MLQRLILIILLLVAFQTSQVFGSDTESVDVSGVLSSRQLVGVVHFKPNRYGLTRQVKAEIDKLVVSAMKKRGEHGIIRIEGFVSKTDSKQGQMSKSLKRARTVWNYMRVHHNIKDNMYLTGFDGNQKISRIKGGRVEIVIYANPFSAESAKVAKTEGN